MTPRTVPSICLVALALAAGGTTAPARIVLAETVHEDGVRPAPQHPASRPYADHPGRYDPSDPVRVADPRRDVVLIFNHGTRRPQYRHPCRRARDIPEVIASLARRTRWRVHYLCSTAIDGGNPGSYTYKRAAEIERTVDAYRAKGLPASHIFLVGQSAGAWSSLIAARRFGRKFNAVIAFAPAFAGPRYEAVQHPHWRFVIRPRQVADLLRAPRIRALVFAFPDDVYNRPRELAFLKRIPGVTVTTFDRCPERGHGTAYSHCFARRALRRIERYIRARLAAKP